jgi:hypothetical protein
MSSTLSSAALITREPGFTDRFWYWRGDSGREYIHSVYPFASCPALPGAVYVAVHRQGDRRIAIAAGRFPSFWDLSSAVAETPGLRNLDADELHVHLLARDAASAGAIASDIAAAIATDVASLDMQHSLPPSLGGDEVR